MKEMIMALAVFVSVNAVEAQKRSFGRLVAEPW